MRAVRRVARGDQPVAVSINAGRNTLIFALTVLGTIALDQSSKAVVVACIEPGRSVTVIPHVLSITHSTNTGAAFGLLRGNGQIVFLAALVIVVMMLVWFFYSRDRMGAWSFLGLGLIVGGAVGNNLLDRVFRGKVVDFIDLGWWPVFNIADIAIIVGVIIVFAGYARELWSAEAGDQP